MIASDAVAVRGPAVHVTVGLQHLMPSHFALSIDKMLSKWRQHRRVEGASHTKHCLNVSTADGRLLPTDLCTIVMHYEVALCCAVVKGRFKFVVQVAGEVG